MKRHMLISFKKKGMSGAFLGKTLWVMFKLLGQEPISYYVSSKWSTKRVYVYIELDYNDQKGYQLFVEPCYDLDILIKRHSFLKDEKPITFLLNAKNIMRQWSIEICGIDVYSESYQAGREKLLMKEAETQEEDVQTVYDRVSGLFVKILNLN